MQFKCEQQQHNNHTSNMVFGKLRNLANFFMIVLKINCRNNLHTYILMYVKCDMTNSANFLQLLDNFVYKNDISEVFSTTMK